MLELIREIFLSYRMEGIVVEAISRGIIIFITILLAFISNFIAKGILLRTISSFIIKSETKLDDYLLERKVFDRLARFSPAIVIYIMAPIALESYEKSISVVMSSTIIYMVIAGLLVINSLLTSLHDIYETFEVSKDVPIKGFFQAANIVVYFVGFILIVSTLLSKNPLYLLSGLGALTAVLMLVFKDVLLGFVAGIQLTANRMIKQGDWIEMPKYGADGDVLDITLTTVKVQNWDMTITTIPTYALISGSFKNWRGMSESGGRRIKRSINIDMNSIKLCTGDMIKRFKKMQYLTSYIERKEEEIKEYNKLNKVDTSTLVNGRNLTNVGTYRAYMEAYLKEHPMINKEMTFLIRQLAPTENGLPIEIYVFSKDKNWNNYEAIQADILDHLLAVLPEFDLAVYQNPTGKDFRMLSGDV